MPRFLTTIDPVKPRSRKDMISFLSDHFRYSTMNSWNCSTSYAVKIKVSHLAITTAERNRIYEVMEVPRCWDISGYNAVLAAFDIAHSHSFQIGTNGRSGGYLVLYQGGQKDSGYKSRCPLCYQLNYKLVTPDCNTCGVCGETRENLTTPFLTTFTYPGKSLDMDKDFTDWDTYYLRDRVSLVHDFDLACESACHTFLTWAMAHRSEARIILVPKTINVAIPE